MTPNVLFPLMRKLAASKDAVGIDVVKYSPYQDNWSFPTARLFNRIMLQYVTGIAMRREGIDPG